jgi:hypothetical protein
MRKLLITVATPFLALACLLVPMSGAQAGTKNPLDFYTLKFAANVCHDRHGDLFPCLVMSVNANRYEVSTVVPEVEVYRNGKKYLPRAALLDTIDGRSTYVRRIFSRKFTGQIRIVITWADLGQFHCWNGGCYQPSGIYVTKTYTFDLASPVRAGKPVLIHPNA